MTALRFDVAVVGAGVHGCTAAVRLRDEWPDLGLALIDPSGACLADWTQRTRGQGMAWMRSPGAHQIDVDPESLLRYAFASGRGAELALPYHRPSLDLFMDHCRWVIARHRLEEALIATRVEAVEPDGAGYRLHAPDGATIEARWLILAPGMRGQESVPGWAGLPPRAVHVEHLDLRREHLSGTRVLIVGGGLSAATLADTAIRGGAHATLVSRHRLEARLFDVDPGWIGPKYMRAFRSEPDPQARLRMIGRARGPGSITPELLARLRRHEASARLRILEEDEVVGASHGSRNVAFRRAGSATFDRVWCCTGFEPRIDQLGWLVGLGEVPACEERPVLPPTLEIRPGCFATGWLAELELGPSARNIAGARAAASRIADRLRPLLPVSPWVAGASTRAAA